MEYSFDKKYNIEVKEDSSIGGVDKGIYKNCTLLSYGLGSIEFVTEGNEDVHDDEDIADEDVLSFTMGEIEFETVIITEL